MGINGPIFGSNNNAKGIKRMKTARIITCLVAIGAFTASVSAQVFNFNIPAGSGAIPDGNQNGIVFQGPVSGVPAPSASVVPVLVGVSLNISGISDAIAANNSDLYVKLIGPSLSAAVLVNRPGQTSSSTGYADNGMNVFLTDRTPGVTQDIHFYQNTVNPNFGQLTGSFQTDGRNVSPSDPNIGGAARTATLSVFDGQNMNGAWQLLVIDVSGGGQAQLNSWGLTFSVIPEPQTYVLIAGLGLLGFAIYRRLSLKAA